MGDIDPQQALFTEIKKQLTGYMVFDGALPPADTPYPFVYLGETTITDDYGNKYLVLADIGVTVHVWHNDFKKRGTLSAMLNDIKTILRGITSAGSFSFSVSSMTQRILEDTTTKTPLMHGVIEINYKLLGG